MNTESEKIAEFDAKMAEQIKADSRALTVSVLPITTLVRIVLLVLRDNVRTAQSYQIPQMVESIRKNGFKPNHPLVISTRPAYAPDSTDLLVLCGNRRTLAVQWLAQHDSATFGQLFPNGEIPAIVYSGLTLAQETLLRVDHGTDENRVPLDEFGEFLAVRQLVQAGFDTQAGIASKLGKYTRDKAGALQPARSWVQQRVNLARLPAFVQDEMRKRCANSDDSPLRWSMIPGLFSAFNAEFLAHPEGNGPKFQEAWKKAMLPKPETATVSVKVSPAQLVETAKAVSSRNLRDTLIAISQGKPVADVDSAISKAETAERILAEIADHLGKTEFAKLCKAARKSADSKPKPEPQPEPETASV